MTYDETITALLTGEPVLSHRLRSVLLLVAEELLLHRFSDLGPPQKTWSYPLDTRHAQGVAHPLSINRYDCSLHNHRRLHLGQRSEPL